MLSSFSFSENTVGFLIEGAFDTKLADQLHGLILEKLKRYPKINLYLEDANIESFSLPAVIDDILFKIKHIESFERVALVTDHKWIHMCGALENLFMDVRIKSFNTEDRLKAIAWIARTD